MEMFALSQNIWIQKQTVNTRFISYGYLVIHLKNILFPATNSAPSKLNLFPQRRSTSTRIPRFGPTQTQGSHRSLLCAGKMSTQEAMDVLRSLPPLFLNGRQQTSNQSPFFCLFSPSCTFSLKRKSEHITPLLAMASHFT